jgi:DNA-binding CsgD family transcriptional regulator
VECERRSHSDKHLGSYGCLTPREEQVVRMAADGLSSKEIARALGIAKRTVDGHFNHARKSVAVKTRTELVVMVLSQTTNSGDDLAGHGRDGAPSSGARGAKTSPPKSGSCPENSSFPDKITQAAASVPHEMARQPMDAGRSHGRGDRGRPTVITPAVIDAVRELRPTHTLKAIAQKLGISRSTLYAHMHELTDM